MTLIKGDATNNTLNGTVDDDTIYGFEGADILYGLEGDDRLDGGSGGDSLFGGAGHDTYVIDNRHDSITEELNAGIDTVEALFSWTLADNLENLMLLGGRALNGTGNALDNKITGNGGNNILRGGAGNDILDGKTSVDFLYGGSGNDLLVINDFNKDTIDGGTGNDVLQVSGSHQRIDLSAAITFIDGIEKIKLSGHNDALVLTAQSVIDLSKESNTLIVGGDADDTLYFNDAGWKDDGISGNYHLFTKQGATVKVNTEVAIADMPSYTISDAATAAQVGSLFTSGAEEVVIDFGGIRYSQTGLSDGVIDLTGFGLEDTLVIAMHDGVINSPVAKYNHNNSQRDGYMWQGHMGAHTLHEDRVSWQTGATKAMLVSVSSAIGMGASVSIQITGLSAGLPDSHVVFV